MAEPNPTQDVDGQNEISIQETAPLGVTLNVVGALASLGLIVGIGVWGYKLVMRDVSGVPVVRAVEGPMRVQPEEPGGRPADHQGLAVNAVAAKGTAEKPAERLVLAPQPVVLADEDQPVATKSAVVASVVPPVRGNAKPSKPDDVAEKPASNEAVDDFKNGSVQSLVDQLVARVMPEQSGENGDAVVIQAAARVAQPAAAAGEVEGAEKKTDEEAVVTLAVLTGPGLKRSLRPQLRPVRAVQSADDEVAPTKAALDVDPDTLKAGTRLAQLGAFESPEVAKEEWNRLVGSFGDYMEDKSRVIQKASSGGRTFYRLRALGFDDISEARRFCSVLVAEKADCIPVTTR